MKKYITIILLLITTFCFGNQNQQNSNNNDNNINIEDQNDSKDSGFLIVPIIGYTPETTVLLGLSFMYIWDRDNSTSSEKPDVFSISGIYTLLNQIITGVTTVNYFDSFLLKSGMLFRKFPSRFYGIGPDSSEDTREDYTPLDFSGKISCLFTILPYFHLGPRYEFGLYKLNDIETSGNLINRTIHGSNGARVSGFGIDAILDTRDSFFYPATGIYMQLISIVYNRSIGSQYNFYRVEFDYRHFFRIYRMHIFAIQYLMKIGVGQMPFQMMPMLGGAHTMRGYYEGRFRDKNYITIQGEYRFPIFWRLSGVLFCGLGQVAPSLIRLSFSDPKVSGGLGLRFSIYRERKINFRIDFAVNNIALNPDDYGLYFYITEAF